MEKCRRCCREAKPSSPRLLYSTGVASPLNISCSCCNHSVPGPSTADPACRSRGRERCDARATQAHWQPGILQQPLQLLIRQRYIGTHHHQPGRESTISIPSAQARQTGRIQRRRTGIRQCFHHAGGRTEQKAFLAAQRPHCSSKSTQLVLPFGIHHHGNIAVEGSQSIDQAGQAVPSKAASSSRRWIRCTSARRIKPSTFLLQPQRQIAAAEPKIGPVRRLWCAPVHRSTDARHAPWSGHPR